MGRPMAGMPDLPALGLPELSEQLRFILDLGVAVALALVGGAIAVRLRQPAVLGYLLAGILIGPATPGFVGDVDRIAELADLGVVLLLFALGVEFSIRGLVAVRRVAIPGGSRGRGQRSQGFFWTMSSLVQVWPSPHVLPAATMASQISTSA